MSLSLPNPNSYFSQPILEDVSSSGPRESLPKTPEPTSIEESLWSQAAAKLLPEERELLQNALSTSVPDIDELLLQVQNKRIICEEKRWVFSIGSKTIMLRNVVDKIISSFNKFKEVGDIMVQYDPAHAALPWAGVRLLLQVGRIMPLQVSIAEIH